MEFEVLLFRVHKFILDKQLTKKIVNYSFKISLAVTFCYLIYFILLNLILSQNRQCINIPYYYTGDNETYYFKNETYFKIYVQDEDQHIINITSSMQRFIFELPEDIIIKHNISIENYTIDYKCYCQNYFYQSILTNNNLETLIISDLMASTNLVEGIIFITQKYQDESKVRKIWNKNIVKERERLNSKWNIIFKIIKFQLNTAIFLFYFTAISSLFFKLIQFGVPVVFNTGWYKLYNRILLNSNKYSPMLFIGYLSFLIIFERIYQFTPSYSLMFDNPQAISSEKLFLMLVSVNEVLSNLFFRTRSSLFFAPKFIIIFYMFHFAYVYSTIYSFYYEMVILIFICSISTVLGFLHFYEIPAMQEWNPNSTYTPKFTRPRVFYFPISQLSWNVDIPQIWTMFYPLHGRKFFSVENLALVDDNVQLLQNYLQQNNVGQAQ